MKRIYQHWILLSCFLASAYCAALPALAQGGNYDTVISQTMELLRNGDHNGAFQKAIEAININAARLEAYYYASVASYFNDQLPAAEKYVNLALGRASAEQKPLYQKSLDAINKKKQFFVRLDVAKKAEDEGLFAKAAREYTAAWDMFPTQTQTGLHAAELWSTRLNNPGEAARILNTIIAQTQDEQIKNEANALLAPMKGALQTYFDEKLRVGIEALEKNDNAFALKALNDAAYALPNRYETYLNLARLYAKQNDIADMNKALGKMLKAGDLPIEKAFFFPELQTQLNDAGFLAWLNDALGAGAKEKITSAIESEKQRAASQSLSSQGRI